MNASARPAISALLTAFWSGSATAVGTGLPSFLHVPRSVGDPSLFLSLVSESSCVVPFSTATRLPHRSSWLLIPSGLPFFTAIDVPALK